MGLIHCPSMKNLRLSRIVIAVESMVKSKLPVLGCRMRAGFRRRAMGCFAFRS